MPKTPDEIKKGLECCWKNRSDIGVSVCNECPYLGKRTGQCKVELGLDALALIQQLEAERDAAVDAIFYIIPSCYLCDYCKHSHPINICPYEDQCKDDYAKWEWRGVQKEE